MKQNREIDRRKAETYSLGVIFYLMLFDAPPKWSHLIPQGRLTLASQQEKLMRYCRFQQLYLKKKKEYGHEIKGIRKDAAALVFKMLDPNPERRISLDAAFHEVIHLSKK